MSKKKLDYEDTFFGIDFGEIHTGTAIGTNGLVMPLETYKDLSQETLIHEIIKVALQNKIKGFVVGLPVQADGKETRQSIVVRRFTKMLKLISKMPVFFQNEFNSSEESLEEAIKIGTPLNKRTNNDSLSAALILKNFYDEQLKKPSGK